MEQSRIHDAVNELPDVVRGQSSVVPWENLIAKKYAIVGRGNQMKIEGQKWSLMSYGSLQKMFLTESIRPSMVLFEEETFFLVHCVIKGCQQHF